MRRHRPGVTLIEVLVAIFIMAIGMLALLALFPLGAVSMAQALKDDRCAQCAINAEALAVAEDIRHDFGVAGNGTWGTLANTTNAFVQPWGAGGAYDLTQVTYTGPSFAVLVDPWLYPKDANRAVGLLAGTTPGIPRRSLVFSANYTSTTHPNVLNATECARWCSALDGITFIRGDGVGQNAIPDQSQGSVIRDGRYTWAWLLRQPRAGSDAVVDMSIVVFSGRPTGAVDGEVTCTAAGAAGSNQVVLTYAGTKPALRRGGWVLDVTPSPQLGTFAGPPPMPIKAVYGYPYRVVGVTDTGPNQVTIEVQTPLRNDVSVMTVLEYAVEVFDRGSFVQP